jgi:hypothetical protein
MDVASAGEAMITITTVCTTLKGSNASTSAPNDCHIPIQIVLDRLLEEKRLRIDGISGTSAGAMNAAALADGYTPADQPTKRCHHGRAL